MQYIDSNEKSWKTAKENGKVARPFALCCDGNAIDAIIDGFGLAIVADMISCGSQMMITVNVFDTLITAGDTMR